jgi:hypothetical protein
MWSLLLAAAAAHDLGYTDAWARFDRGGSWALEIQVDVGALPAGFPLGQPRPGRPTRAARPADLALLDETLRGFWAEAVRPGFDGALAPFDVSLTNWADGQPLPADEVVVVRLSGEIPPGADAFTWSADPAAGPLLLTLVQTGQSGSVVAFLDAGESPEPFRLTVAPPAPTVGGTIARYVGLGFEHIVPKGLDHILFVLGLFLLAPRIRPLLAQVSAFTLAHTATLGLATLGVLSLPAAVVEPLIALSIAAVALENVAREDLSRWRPAVVFGFGLLHGLGFAGVLSELGLPAGQVLLALLSFNVGVELGQLAVIAAAAALVARWREAPWYRRRVAIPASLGIAGIGLYWAVERILG